MIVVINAGGSGTRLWPLSTPSYPKQFLSIVGQETLLQSAFRRAKELTTVDKIYIIPEKSHAHLVKEQLPGTTDANYIVEPGRRGTAGCVIAGMHHVSSRHDPDEPIGFIHSDHSIRDVGGFASSFRHAAEAAVQNGRLTLVGIEPTYPATGLGYIHKDNELTPGSQIYQVESFKEKPDYDLAQQYEQSGEYLWNCGYFVGSLNTFVRVFEQFSPRWKGYYDQLQATKTQDEYEQTYLSFEGDAIDYALIEHVTDLLVVPATFDWMDVGNFKDAHDIAEKDEVGNHLRGEGLELIEVESSFIRNEEAGKAIAVIGLDNIVVVNTKEGILVARRDVSQKVGEIAKKLQADQ